MAVKATTGFLLLWVGATCGQTMCPQDVLKGVVLYEDRQQDVQKLFKSMQRLDCNGGNAIQIPIQCAQPTVNSTEITCPELPRSESHKLSMTIRYAQCLGFTVMLQMSVQTTNSGEVWAAHIGRNFGDAQWTQWFQSWTSHLVEWSAYSQRMQVDLMSIGCELTQPQVMSHHWRQTMAAIRSKMAEDPSKLPPKFTYGADKRSERDVSWWDELDFISSHPYYRLANHTETPSDKELLHAWREYVDNFAELSNKNGNKKILFTEVGYRSMNNAHKCPACWTWSNGTNHKLQAQLFTALLETYCARPQIFGGVFFMGWPQDIEMDVNSIENAGYEFAGKPAENVMKLYFNPSTGTCDEDKFVTCKQKITGIHSSKLANMHASSQLLATDPSHAGCIPHSSHLG